MQEQGREFKTQSNDSSRTVSMWENPRCVFVENSNDITRAKTHKINSKTHSSKDKTNQELIITYNLDDSTKITEDFSLMCSITAPSDPNLGPEDKSNVKGTLELAQKESALYTTPAFSINSEADIALNRIQLRSVRRRLGRWFIFFVSQLTSISSRNPPFLKYVFDLHRLFQLQLQLQCMLPEVLKIPILG